MAEGVRTLLEAPHDTPIVDRLTERARDLQPGDVAVLVFTNLEAERLTTALALRGIRAAVARAGLLDTPEGTLVEAALSYAADARDARSRAVVEALTGFSGKSPDAWLEGGIVDHSERARARQAGEAPTPSTLSGVAQRLSEVRDDLQVLAPSEALDLVLSAIDAAAICARWPDSEQRLANLDALRALAARYEVRCKQRRESASVSGLLRFFIEAKQKVMVQNEELASDDQHTSHGPHCVTVTTYHKAKGLEWPVVVLGSLDREERRDAFSVLPQSDRDTFDPIEPLGGRWIRYWPWPYASHTNAPLSAAVERSAEGRAVQQREERERVRLLYVGFTRARDHLILAVRPGRQAPKTAWLDELCDAGGVPLLELPLATPAEAHATVAIRSSDGLVSRFSARVWSLSTGSDPVLVLPKSDSTRWFAGGGDRDVRRSRYRISPSRAAVDWPQVAVGAVGQLAVTGPRLPLGSESPQDWSSVGDAFHAFLAADLPGLTQKQRLERARRLLAASELLALLEPDALVRAGDQLRGWVESRWPRAIWHRELPIAGALATAQGSRRVEGTIDLLLEVDDGVVLIDHKTYPGRKDTWCDKASEYAPQLAAYAQVLGMAGRSVSSQWISFAVTGGVVQINERRQPARAVAGGG